MQSSWHDQSWARAGRLGEVRISTIDMHTAGEPLRIITRAAVLPEGRTIIERRRHAQIHWDRLRRILMFEPRGHADMYGALIVPPERVDSHFGVLFMHNEGYSTMCGHAIIALGKAAVELGWVALSEPITEVRIDAPAGLVIARAAVREGKVVSVAFENVPSFAPLLDGKVEVPDMGPVNFDLGFGGAFYAYVDADRLGLELSADNARKIGEAGMAIKHAVMREFQIKHPVEADLGYLYGTIFTSSAMAAGRHSRHACVFAEGAIDRSPTGTGVAGRVAILAARKQIRAGQPPIFIESVTGEAFGGRVLRSEAFHGVPAVIPEVEGQAFFTGRHEFFIEPGDSLAEGFLVR